MDKSRREEVIDQIAHLAWTFMALLPIVFWPNPLGGALSGLLFSLPRELWDQRKSLSDSFPWITRGKALDITFFSVGGLLAGIITAL